MKNIFIALKTGYDNQSVREVYSRLQHFSFLVAVVLLVGGLASCSLGNTSRWKMMGNSMEPNLNDGQVIKVETVEDLSSLQRGEMIVFEWNGESLVKRLIALPGESIEIRQGSIIINGKVYDEPYDVIPSDYDLESTKLGVNEYFVLGDNRNESRDSHNFGPITSEMIKGRVVP